MTNDPSRLLIVASNRGPVSYGHAEDGSLTAKRGGGGMVSGLTSGLGAVAADGGALWLCAALSEADREAARQAERASGEPASRARSRCGCSTSPLTCFDRRVQRHL